MYDEIRTTVINKCFRVYSWFHNYIFLISLVSYISTSDIKTDKSGLGPLHPATYVIKIPNLNLMGIFQDFTASHLRQMRSGLTTDKLHQNKDICLCMLCNEMCLRADFSPVSQANCCFPHSSSVRKVILHYQNTSRWQRVLISKLWWISLLGWFKFSFPTLHWSTEDAHRRFLLSTAVGVRIYGATSCSHRSSADSFVCDNFQEKHCRSSW